MSFQINPQLEEQIRGNFDVSIIMPFYHKLEDFRRTLPANRAYFERNGIEVIVCLDAEDEEAGLLELVQAFPFINWRILINRKPRAGWRNPCKVLNVAVRHATKKYILAIDPESEWQDDIVFRFRYLAAFYPDAYFVGRVLFVDYDFQSPGKATYLTGGMPYGSLMATRECFEAIGGYNECFTTWGGDDDDIRARLGMLGLQRMYVPEALLLHREEGNSSGHHARDKKSARLSIEEKRRMFFPEQLQPNGDDWGKDFGEFIYDYLHNRFAAAQLARYAEKFEAASLPDPALLEKEYNVIALLLTRNEIKHVPEVLQHLDTCCDGIILLDDGSTDGCYEAAVSEKLLLKVQQQHVDPFNELAARNTLLDLASFFRSRYFFFHDADERFDKRFMQVNDLVRDLDAATTCFYLVHLWDDAQHYRADIPEISPLQRPGIIARWRLFRNTGHMQIYFDRTLHMPATPYKDQQVIAPVLLLHYGMMDAALRAQKRSTYETIDPCVAANPGQYSYFTDEQVKRLPLAAIQHLPFLQNKKIP